MSVLRYPGGKTRGVPVIAPFLPTDEVIHSPFFGGGSVELYMTRRYGTEINANDVYEPLINFWRCLKSPEKRLQLIRYVKGRLPITAHGFKCMQTRIDDLSITDSTRAAMFYIVNRASFNGGTASAGFSRHNAGLISKERLRDLGLIELDRVRFSADHFDSFLDTISTDDFLFLDPPYAIRSDHLYGVKGDAHRSFDHEALAIRLRPRRRWVLCYNDSEYIRSLYGNCKIVEVSWYHSLQRGNNGNNELIIMPWSYYGELQTKAGRPPTIEPNHAPSERRRSDRVRTRDSSKKAVR